MYEKDAINRPGDATSHEIEGVSPGKDSTSHENHAIMRPGEERGILKISQNHI
jgi:hypothetical protein